MRSVPSTPNPGSSVVSSRISGGELDCDGGAVGVGVVVEVEDNG